MLIFLLFLSQVTYQPSGHWDLAKIGITKPGPFEVRPDGAVAVFDFETMQLMLIDANGRLTAKCGEKGERRGAFQSPRQVAWVPHEHVYAVYDITNRQISKWNESGKLVEEYDLPKPLNRPVLLENHLILACQYPLGFHGFTPALVAFNPKDQSSQVLWEHEIDDGELASGSLMEGKKFTLAMEWNPQLKFDVGSDFVVVTFGDTNQIHLLDFQGKPLTTPITVDLPMVPLTDEQFVAGFESLPKQYRANAEKISIRTSNWPYIRDLIVDDQDRIWVFGSSKSLAHPFPFVVFDANGKQLTTGKVGRIPGEISGQNMYAVLEQPTPILQKLGFSW